MRNFLSLFVCAILALAFVAISGLACTCALIPSPCDEYRASAAVFIGTVVQVSNLEGRTPEGRFVLIGGSARIKVDRTFKGELPEVVAFPQGMGGDCLPVFKEGQTWLIYADLESRKSGTRLEPRACSRNQWLSQAADDLAYLQKLPEVVETTYLSGRLRLATKNESALNQPEQLAGIRVTIIGENSQYDVLTDAKGFFELAGFVPGKYTVALELPAKLKRPPSEKNTEVLIVNSSCNSLNFLLQLATETETLKKSND